MQGNVGDGLQDTCQMWNVSKGQGNVGDGHQDTCQMWNVSKGQCKAMWEMVSGILVKCGMSVRAKAMWEMVTRILVKCGMSVRANARQCGRWSPGYLSNVECQ